MPPGIVLVASHLRRGASRKRPARDHGPRRPASHRERDQHFGQVARQAETSTNATDGFLDSNGKMTDLGANFFPAAINNKGQIVANAYDTATYQTHALLLNPS